MNPASLAALDEQGLRLELDSIAAQELKASEYEALRHISHGEFLLRELEDRRDLARRMYAHIDPAHQHAVSALIHVQAQEREATEWITRIQNSKSRLDELRAQRETLSKIVQNRKESSIGDEFVPEAMRKERKQ